MPNIAQYANPVDRVTPSDVGVQANDQAGMRISENYQRAGEGVSRGIQQVAGVTDLLAKHQTQTEVSQYTAGVASAQASLTDKWNNIVKTTDPNLIPKARVDFLQNDVAPTLTNLQNGFGSSEAQMFANDHSADVASHFITMTAADESQASMQALSANFGKTNDALAAMVNKDPTSLDSALNTATKSLNSLVANSTGLTGEQIIALHGPLLRENQAGLVSSAVYGAMTNVSPQAGLTLLANPKYAQYLSADQQLQLQNTARTITRFDQSQARLAQIQGQMAQVQQANATYSDIISKAFANPGDAPALFRSVLTNRTFDQSPNIKLSALSTMERFQSGAFAPVGDPNIVANLRNQALQTPGSTGALTPTVLLHALNTNQISKADYNQINQIQEKAASDPTFRDQQKGYTDWMQSAKAYIAPGGTAQGLQAFSQFATITQQRFLDGINAGHTVQELTTIGSKFYIGTDMPAYIQAGSSLNMPTYSAQGDEIPSASGVVIGEAASNSLSEADAGAPAPTDTGAAAAAQAPTGAGSDGGEVQPADGGGDGGTGLTQTQIEALAPPMPGSNN